MDQKQLTQIKNDYLLMVSHLRQANEIATRLGAYLDPVQGPAPKRGRKQINADIRARVIAKRMKSILKYQPK